MAELRTKTDGTCSNHWALKDYTKYVKTDQSMLLRFSLRMQK
jgi:hypothetical protein